MIDKDYDSVVAFVHKIHRLLASTFFLFFDFVHYYPSPQQFHATSKPVCCYTHTQTSQPHILFRDIRYFMSSHSAHTLKKEYLGSARTQVKGKNLQKQFNVKHFKNMSILIRKIPNRYIRVTQTVDVL